MRKICEKAALNEALRSLNNYVRSMSISVDILEEIDTKVIEEYFDTDDINQIKLIEKMMAASAIDAIYNDSSIPKNYKSIVAEQVSEEFVDSFRGARVEYKYIVGHYGSGQRAIIEYERAKNEIVFCKRVIQSEHLKGSFTWKLASKGFKVKKVKGALLAACFGLAADAVCMVLPKKARDEIKEQYKKIADLGIKTVRAVSTNVKETKVVQKAVEIVAKYVTPIVKPVYEKTQKIAENGKKRMVNGIKSMFIAWKKIY